MSLWTEEQVEALNNFQKERRFHPFTCPNRGDEDHDFDAVLVATKDGWICPHCDYTQNWAHGFMMGGKHG